jgi:hypothetical protein
VDGRVPMPAFACCGKGNLLGFISEEIILESNDIDRTLADFELVGKQCGSA